MNSTLKEITCSSMFPSILIPICRNDRIVVILICASLNIGMILYCIQSVDSRIALTWHRKSGCCKSIVHSFLVAILFFTLALIPHSFFVVVYSCLQSIISSLNGWKISCLMTLLRLLFLWLLHLVVLLQQLNPSQIHKQLK